MLGGSDVCAGTPDAAVRSDAAAVGWKACLPGYRRRLVSADLLAGAAASAGAYAGRFWLHTPVVHEYAVLVLVLPLVWVAVLALNHGYDARLLGAGASEYQQVVNAFVYTLAAVAVSSYVTRAELARGFVVLAIPFAAAFSLACRYGLRRALHRRRLQGLALSTVVLVGTPAGVADLAGELARHRGAGYRVIGACLTPSAATDTDAGGRLSELGMDFVGSVDDLVDVVRTSQADTVAVVSSREVGSERLRTISWQLEGSGAELLVSPGLVEVAGTRLHVRPVADLPLLHVEQPAFKGVRRWLKEAFDRFCAGIALVALAPVLLVIAAVVRLTSRGPAFFLQTRVGRDGKHFKMVKFRSMHVDAEKLRVQLIDLNKNSDGLLFKVVEDPRVTRFGRVLRRYSLDELPQLVNVLLGSMSLVGPRPPLPSEAEAYGDHVKRRLLVKPGLTGLWQVSGRSDLSWEESVRLDLRYVENWSLTLDASVLLRTVRAVIHGAGAY